MAVDGLTLRVTHTFPQPVAAVWALLTDIEQMAGLGPEHVEASWDTAARGLGATFHGTNQRGEHRWTVTCTVIIFDEPRAFGWWVGRHVESPVATWRYELTATETGTTVVHTFTHGSGRSGLTAAIDGSPADEQSIIAFRSTELKANMTLSLAAAERLLQP